MLEVLAAFERAIGKPIPYEIQGRRDGDIAIYFADVQYAEKVLGWKAELDMDAMARDAWHWQQQNPQGY